MSFAASSTNTCAPSPPPTQRAYALPLGAFIEVHAEQALEEADAADLVLANTPPGERRGLPLLLGIPTAHKDLVDVRGFTTTHGSSALPHVIAISDNPIVAAVRRSGAICIGKTQVPEFGIAGYSENLIAAPTRNPFDPSRTAGGSSGGTAAAIASGMICAAIGSDAGGSIRIPAAACGLVGLKPGRGVVPADALQGERDELGAPRMAVSGPMARTARDAALFFDAITRIPPAPGRAVPIGGAVPAAGFAPAGLATAGVRPATTGVLPSAPAFTSALSAVERAHDLNGLRIGVSFDSPFESNLDIRFDEAALTAVDTAIGRLESSGHHAAPASIDYGSTYPEAFTTVWTQALTRMRLDAGAEAKLGELAQWFLERARAADPNHVAKCVSELHDFARNAAAQWGAYDVVLTPALAFDAPKIGEFVALGAEGDYRLQCEWAPQTSMVNVAGLPAIVVPVAMRGSDATDAALDALPRGVQLIGRAGSEHQLLQLAAQLLGE